MLSKVFTNPNTTIIGFSFQNDMNEFAKKHPHL